MNKTGPEQPFEVLLEYLTRTRGFNFGAYKRTSLMRRVQKRMDDVKVQNFVDYIDYLEVHPDEFLILFNTILINVTGFFRDAATWEFLAQDILPRLVETRGSAQIRVWSAGCASGEEAYTISMLLAEVLGREAYRERIKIYATDIDEQALNQARQALFSQKQVESVPKPLLDKYFERADSNYIFDKELRRSVIFGRLDLLQDAPISRVDLIICRNTLMYFNAEAQTRILRQFNFALNDHGLLYLGRSESLLTRERTFAPLDIKRRIFTRIPRVEPRQQLPGSPLIPAPEYSFTDLSYVLRQAALEADPVAQFLVDTTGCIAFVNEEGRRLFHISEKDLGRPLQDLELSYRPVELRSLIENAYAERRVVRRQDVEWAGPDANTRYFDLLVIPLTDALGAPLGCKIHMTDITQIRRLHQELQDTQDKLESAYAQLQSANEELETTNEELQSTNEELETMNEELQSTNEELNTTNDELGQRSRDADEATTLLESILTSLPEGLVVVDQDLKILAWNHQSEEMWGMRLDEVRGKPLLNLDIGLPLEKTKPILRACLAGKKTDGELVLDATNRRGKAIRVSVTCSPLAPSANPPRGAILMIQQTH